MKRVLLLTCIVAVTWVHAQLDQESLTKRLSDHHKNSDLPGFAVCIIGYGKVIFQQGFGYSDKLSKKPYTIHSIQNIGSVSKTFTGLAVVKAISDGYLSLDDEINEILPFSVINPHFPETPILVRHLLNHTSSIQDGKKYGKSYISAFEKDDRLNVHGGFSEFIFRHEEMSNEQFLVKILTKKGEWYSKKNFIKSKPGETNGYSNLNAALAGVIVEEATGIPFKEYVQENILGPIAMESSGWDFENIDMKQHATLYFPAGGVVPWYSLITYPDGGLKSTISDIASYLIEMIKAYEGSSVFLSAEYARMLLPGDDDNDRAFWGMGTKSRNIGHSGSDPGVQVDMQFNADSKIGRIIFCNTNAEDNEQLAAQYNGIHEILREFESTLK